MKRKTILIVEDDQSIRNAISHILDRNGFRTLTAIDGNAALPLVDHADVVLLDLLMPVMDGETFLRRIRSDKNYIPVVIMSAAYGRDESLLKLKDLKIVEFLEKPFTADHLLLQVRKACVVADDMKTVEEASGILKAFLGRQKESAEGGQPPSG